MFNKNTGSMIPILSEKCIYKCDGMTYVSLYIMFGPA